MIHLPRSPAPGGRHHRRTRPSLKLGQLWPPTRTSGPLCRFSCPISVQTAAARHHITRQVLTRRRGSLLHDMATSRIKDRVFFLRFTELLAKTSIRSACSEHCYHRRRNFVWGMSHILFRWWCAPYRALVADLSIFQTMRSTQSSAHLAGHQSPPSILTCVTGAFCPGYARTPGLSLRSQG